MKKNKISFLGILLFVLIVVSGFSSLAYEFVDFTATPIKNEIHQGEETEFLLTIQNEQTTSQKLMISIPDFSWVPRTEPTTAYTTGIFLSPHQTKNITLFLKPRKTMDTKLYSVKIDLWDPNKKINDLFEIVDIKILPEDLSKYPTDVSVDIDMPRYVDPRDPISIKVDLINKNKKPLKNLEVELKSNLINQKTTIDLDGNEEKTLEFTVNLKGVDPQEDKITLTIKEDGKILNSVVRTFEISSYTTNFEVEEKTKNKFLIFEKTIKLTNVDNIVRKENYIYSTSLFNSLFSKITPEYSSKEYKGLKVYYIIPVELSPGKSMNINTKENYYPILIVILGILLIYILYLIFRSPLVVVKKAQHVKIHEGGIAEVKILIYLKNRAKHKLENIVLIDKIPNIALVALKNELDMVEPKLYHTKDGKKFVKWVLDDFEGKEERILTYRIKTKLAVVGDLGLDPAIAQFEIGSKKTRVYSNSVKIKNLAEMEELEE